MRIPLIISEKNGLSCFIFLKLNHRWKVGLRKIMFIVDTGSSTTMLTNQHAKMFGWSLNVEDKSPAFQLAGHIMKKKSLGQTNFSFQTPGGNTIQLEANPLYLALTTSNRADDRERAEYIPALIGRDFLIHNKLTLHYDTCKNEAYLEKCDSN